MKTFDIHKFPIRLHPARFSILILMILLLLSTVMFNLKKHQLENFLILGLVILQEFLQFMVKMELLYLLLIPLM